MINILWKALLETEVFVLGSDDLVQNHDQTSIQGIVEDTEVLTEKLRDVVILAACNIAADFIAEVRAVKKRQFQREYEEFAREYEELAEMQRLL